MALKQPSRWSTSRTRACGCLHSDARAPQRADGAPEPFSSFRCSRRTNWWVAIAIYRTGGAALSPTSRSIYCWYLRRPSRYRHREHAPPQRAPKASNCCSSRPRPLRYCKLSAPRPGDLEPVFQAYAGECHSHLRGQVRQSAGLYEMNPFRVAAMHDAPLRPGTSCGGATRSFPPPATKHPLARVVANETGAEHCRFQAGGGLRLEAEPGPVTLV